MTKPCYKVLIVDDSSDDRVTCRRVLQRNPETDYLIEEADLGGTGLAVCQSFQPDCLLLDYHLPDLDGLQFLTRLHEQAGPQVPAVVMMTGTGHEAIAVEAMKRGVQDYLVKGALTLENLSRAVANAIEKVMLRRTLEAQHRELRESEEALRQQAEIIDQTHDAVIATDLEGLVTSWNKGAERLFGYTAAEMAGHSVLGLFPEELQTQFSTRVMAPLREHGRHELETRQNRKSGGECYIHLSLSLRRDQQGTPTGIIGYAIDITARKQAEDAVQRVNAELQQFAYVVSHDLNEPLRTVANFVKLLASQYQGKLDTTADEYIAFVTDGARRMQQMLTDLLSYTQVGGQDLTFAPVDCETRLADVLNALRTAIKESGATITYDPLPTVHGDATRLSQVWQNLIGNALKFRSDAPPRIHVSAQWEGQYWRFSVRDNGIGIDPQQADRIFQVFQRLHTRDEYQGTGIGLAICKKIVERHGGRIWVESQPEQGATFYFTLRDDFGTGETR